MTTNQHEPLVFDDDDEERAAEKLLETKTSDEDSGFKRYDIHEDPKLPFPRGMHHLGMKGDMTKPNPNPLPTIKIYEVKEPLIEDIIKYFPDVKVESTEVTLQEPVNDLDQLADVGASSKKPSNFYMQTMPMQVKFSDLKGYGHRFPKSSTSTEYGEASFGITLTTKPHLPDKEYREMYDSLGDTKQKCENMKHNLESILEMAAVFIRHSKEPIIKDKAVIYGKIKSENPTENPKQLERRFINKIKELIKVPWSVNGDEFTVKFASNAFFEKEKDEKKQGRNKMDEKILNIMDHPIYGKDAGVKLAREFVMAEHAKGSNFSRPNYTWVEGMPAEIIALEENPFFHIAPPGSIVSIYFHPIFTKYMDKVFIKLCLGCVNQYHYQVKPFTSSNEAPKAPSTFKRMVQDTAILPSVIKTSTTTDDAKKNTATTATTTITTTTTDVSNTNNVTAGPSTTTTAAATTTNGVVGDNNNHQEPKDDVVDNAKKQKIAEETVDMDNFDDLLG